MGQEIEYKLRADSRMELMEAYRRVIASAEAGEEQTILMETRYFDTPSRELQAKKRMLRIRRENEQQVLTCKTPAGEHARGEWSLPRTLSEAAPQPVELEALIAMGAPEELRTLSGLCVFCGAKFTRRCTMLSFEDGTRVELAADEGQLLGQTERVDFCELELELYGGDEQKLSALAAVAGLPEEPLSKAARAFRLR